MIAPRVFTAPVGFDAEIEIKGSQEVSQHFFINDDSFKNSLLIFEDRILRGTCKKERLIIKIQSALVEKIAVSR